MHLVTNACELAKRKNFLYFYLPVTRQLNSVLGNVHVTSNEEVGITCVPLRAQIGPRGPLKACNLWSCKILWDAVYEKLCRNVNTMQEMSLKQQWNVLLSHHIFFPLSCLGNAGWRTTMISLMASKHFTKPFILYTRGRDHKAKVMTNAYISIMPS